MDKIFLAAAVVSMLLVVGSLIAGLVAMSRTTENSPRTSNKMMRMRVLFQGLAIMFLFLAYLSKNN